MIASIVHLLLFYLYSSIIAVASWNVNLSSIFSLLLVFEFFLKFTLFLDRMGHFFFLWQSFYLNLKSNLTFRPIFWPLLILTLIYSSIFDQTRLCQHFYTNVENDFHLLELFSFVTRAQRREGQLLSSIFYSRSTDDKLLRGKAAYNFCHKHSVITKLL